MSVRAQPRVIGKIPANMVWILVDHDLIASPIPARHDVEIVRGDVPVEVVEPEALRVSSRQHEYMLRSKTAAEMSVCPWLSEMVMRIGSATIVSNPFIVLRVNVRNVRMTLPVHFHAVLGRRLLCPGRSRGARRPGSPRGSRAASRNVPTANRGMTAAAVRLSAALPKYSQTQSKPIAL